MAELAQPAPFLRPALFSGLVIPAHPLALTDQRRFDERRMRALTRYYLDAGAGGLAVAVHSTQFAIRDPRHGLFEPVLRVVSAAADEWEAARGALPGPAAQPIVRVAGVVGPTAQAVREARLARELGYQAGLLSLAALPDADDAALIAHARRVAEELPLFGFYLQPAVGGRVLGYRFWRQFCELDNVVGIKIAPFNRYQTLDVARAVAESGRAHEIALYTGNDDHILLDLLGEYAFTVDGQEIRIAMQGGLLGHWAVWTHQAVALLGLCRSLRAEQAAGRLSAGSSIAAGSSSAAGSSIAAAGTAGRAANGSLNDLLVLANQLTDCNAAFFDAANNYAGVLPGIHEVLRRQGLLANALCLDEHERLSPGQAEEIERVWRAYPHLNDDDFVAANLSRWLA